MYQIANEELILEVTEQGAEMKSLKDRASGREYLWCGDAKYWKRTAPVLFPLVVRIQFQNNLAPVIQFHCRHWIFHFYSLSKIVPLQNGAALFIFFIRK